MKEILFLFTKGFFYIIIGYLLCKLYSSNIEKFKKQGDDPITKSRLIRSKVSFYGIIFLTIMFTLGTFCEAIKLLIK